MKTYTDYIQTHKRFKRTLIYYDILTRSIRRTFSGKSLSSGHKTRLNTETVKNNENLCVNLHRVVHVIINKRSFKSFMCLDPILER